MTARLISLTIVAFVLGALSAGGIGVRVIREVRTAEDATSLPTQNIATTSDVVDEYQVDPHETLIASTALVPVSISAEEGDIAIEYELISLAPRLGVAPVENLQNFGVIQTVPSEDLDHIYPHRWVVDTPNGPVEGGPANVSSRVARFDADDPLTVSRVESVRILQARAPFPFAVPVTISEAEPTVEVIPGVSIELLKISDQGSTTIIQIGIDADDEAVDGVFVSGDGPGWRSAVFEAEGRPRVNLTWIGGPLPADIPLTATGTVWVVIDGPFDVSLDGVR